MTTDYKAVPTMFNVSIKPVTANAIGFMTKFGFDDTAIEYHSGVATPVIKLSFEQIKGLMTYKKIAFDANMDNVAFCVMYQQQVSEFIRTTIEDNGDIDISQYSIVGYPDTDFNKQSLQAEIIGIKFAITLNE